MRPVQVPTAGRTSLDGAKFVTSHDEIAPLLPHMNPDIDLSARKLPPTTDFECKLAARAGTGSASTKHCLPL